MESHTQEAFSWIISLLQEHSIPFQIIGGLASKMYGATRPLADIDCTVLKESIEKLLSYVKEYISYGPKLYKDKNWELFLRTLVYQEQEIDIACIDRMKIFNSKQKKWEGLKIDFSHFQSCTIYGFVVPVIQKKELILYKMKLGRKADRLDVYEISEKNSHIVEDFSR